MGQQRASTTINKVSVNTSIFWGGGDLTDRSEKAVQTYRTLLTTLTP